jgi:hypothetical protein
VRILDVIPKGFNELAALLRQILETLEFNSSWSNYRLHKVLLEVAEATKILQNLAVAKPFLENCLALSSELTPSELHDKVTTAIAVIYGHFSQWENALNTLVPLPDNEKTDTFTQILDLWVDHHKAANVAPSSAS